MENEDFFSRDALSFRPSAIRAFAKLINNPDIISFAGGVPSPDTFPAEALADVAAQVIRTNRAVALQYGPTRGLPRLREFIAGLCATRKIQAHADDVLVTTGSQQALDLVARVLLDPGDVVLVELPTYIGASSSFYARSASLEGVAQDDDGIVPESLREVATRVQSSGRRVKFLYTIPNFQNPSGRLMSQQRRLDVLEIARELGFLVVEDDPYGELVYVDEADTTPMASSDARVLYLGSFSKVLAPGLRCGFVVGPQAFLQKLEVAKEAADLCSGMLDQSVVDEFCWRGLLGPQIAAVRSFYREKRNLLMTELERHFAGRASWTPADGGLFSFLTLHSQTDTVSAVPRSIESGVAYVPGQPFFVDGSGRNTMRLTFAKEPDDRIREGVARLARVFPE